LMVSVYVLLLTTLREPADVRKLQRAIFAAGVAFVLICLFEYARSPGSVLQNKRFVGIAGNPAILRALSPTYAVSFLFGHFDIAFTVMAQVLLKLLPLWLPSFVLLNLICLAWNSLAVRIPSIRAVCDRRFFVAMNCIVMLLSVDIFFAVVSVKIETFGQ